MFWGSVQAKGFPHPSLLSSAPFNPVADWPITNQAQSWVETPDLASLPGLGASEPARVAHTLGLQLPRCTPLTHSVLPEELEGSFQGLLCLHPYSERRVRENTLMSQAGT